MRLLFYILFGFFSFYVGAQNNFIETTAPIRSLALSANNKNLYYIDNSELVKVDFATFEVLERQPVVIPKDYSVDQLSIIDGKLLKVKLYHDRVVRYGKENILDSLVLLLPDGKRQFASPGYTYIDARDSINIVGANNNFSYEQDGDTIIAATKGIFALFINGEKVVEKEATSVIVNLKLLPQRNEAVIIYENGYRDYLIERVDLDTLETLASQPFKIVENGYGLHISNLHISEQEDLIAFELSQIEQSLFRNHKIELLDIETLNKPSQSKEYSDVEGHYEDGFVYEYEGIAIVKKEYHSQKITSESVSGISGVTGFFKVDDTHSILTTIASDIQKTASGIYKYNMDSYREYDEVAWMETDTTYLYNDPNQVKVYSNILQPTTDYTTNASHSLLLTSNQDLWDLNLRRKIDHLSLSNRAISLLNPQGTKILIIEKHPRGKAYWIFKEYEISSGTMTVSQVMSTKEYGSISFSHKTYAGTTQDGKVWHFLDGEQFIALDVLSSQLEVEMYKELEVENDPAYSEKLHTAIYQLYAKPDSQVFIQEREFLSSNSNEKGKRSFFLHQPATREITELSLDSQAPLFVSMETSIQQKGSTINLKKINTAVSKTLDISKGEEIVNVLNNNTHLFIQTAEQRKGYIYIIDSSLMLQDKIVLKSAYGELLFASERGIVYKDNGIKEYLSKGETYRWRQKISKNNARTFDADKGYKAIDEGFLFLENQDLLDLKQGVITRKFPSYKELFLSPKDSATITYNKVPVDFRVSKSLIDYAYDDSSSTNKEEEALGFRSRYVKVDKGTFYTLSYDDYFEVQKNDALLTAQTNTQNKRTLTIKNSASTFYKFLISPDGQSAAIVFADYGDFSKPYHLTFINLQTFTISSELNTKIRPEAVLNNGNILGELYGLKEYKLDDGNEEIVLNYLSPIDISQAMYDDNTKSIYALAGSTLRVYAYGNKICQSVLALSNSSEFVNLKMLGEQLLAKTADGSIHFIDVTNHKELVTLNSFKSGEKTSYAWTTPEGYFMADKNAVRNLHFVRNGKVFPLSNYELFLNRPDIILSRLGFADAELIKNYKEAFLKRLDAYGYTENTDYLTIQKPAITLTNSKDFDGISATSDVILGIRSSEDIAELRAYVNGVPVSAIKDVKPIQELPIILGEGENTITVEGVNSSGILSDPVTVEVTYKAFAKAKKVHYIGIGVSTYKDSTWNLKYADKDVRSIAKQLGYKMKDLVIDTLTNKQATLTNILALKNKLLNTDIDDKVIISFSGHGVINEEKEFFFAPYDMDFENPEASGLSYQKIEWLLSDIPARKKLILLDACHSGEIDPSEKIETEALSNKNVSSYTPKGAIAIKKKKKGGLINSFSLMQSLFYDIKRGNGSYVISAAGGKEFAYESKEWDNGVFTYSFLRGLDELSSTYGDNDGTIHISELKEYIYNSVTKLTSGQQKPTARAENIEWDWELITRQ